MFYFAYCSNLHQKQMKRMCKNSKYIGCYTLKNFKLSFRNYYLGCGVADIEKKQNSFKVSGKLEIVENLGHEKILCVRTIKSKQLFYLRVSSEYKANVGENIDIYIDENKLLFFDPNNEYLIER